MALIYIVLCVQNDIRLGTNVMINNIHDKTTIKDICKLFVQQIEKKSNPFIKILNEYMCNDQNRFKNLYLLIGEHIENITEKQLSQLFTDSATTTLANLNDKYMEYTDNFIKKKHSLYIMLDSYQNTNKKILYNTCNLDMYGESWIINEHGILQYKIPNEYKYVKIKNTKKIMKIKNNYGILSNINGNVEIYELKKENWEKIYTIDSLPSSRILVIN